MPTDHLSDHSTNFEPGQSAYACILLEIENGSLIPGDRLRETELAKRINVSRTPIRESLRLLETDGLVTHIPCQGTCVKQLSYAEIMELYDMRVVLECAATRLAAHAASELERHHLRLIHTDFAHSQTAEVAANSNQKFHYTLLQAAKNRFLLQSHTGLHKTLMLLGSTTLDDDEP